MSLPTFTFYSRPEYFEDLIERVCACRKGDRVTVMTMTLDPHVVGVDYLLVALGEAARRGVRVSLSVDARTFMQANHAMLGPLFYGTSLTVIAKKPYGTIFQRLEKLRHQGGEYHIINKPVQPFSNPYAGRSHIKLALINDRVYIPSCNLDSDEHLDLIVAWQDAKTATWLRNLYNKIINVGNVTQALEAIDQVHKINSKMTLFVDSGIKRHSLIYQQALDLMSQAEQQLYITCQYFPGGTTARYLLDAQDRGVDVSIAYSHPAAHGLQYPGQWAYNLRQKLRLPTSFFSGQLPRQAPKLHAKLLTSGHCTLTGSHNYVTAGVSMGTAEIALLIQDAAFAKAAKQKISSQIATVSNR